MGFDFRVLVTEADENAPDHLNGIETAVWISEQKAKALQPALWKASSVLLQILKFGWAIEGMASLQVSRMPKKCYVHSAENP